MPFKFGKCDSGLIPFASAPRVTCDLEHAAHSAESLFLCLNKQLRKSWVSYITPKMRTDPEISDLTLEHPQPEKPG